ncbi:hypothetical protein B4N84_27215 [Flavobacterium sp. IR1]|nr:hypothetical protein B4N84_27215 [Flavobacterium sp. IR1]
MSITRIVGGTIRKTAKGNIDIRATGGDLTLHATQNNNWSAGEGIYYEDYEPSHPDDKMDNKVELTLNLFFDGTGNNKTNIEAREKNTTPYHRNSNKKDDSYTANYTNVARMYDAVSKKAPKQLNIYIEGVGTADLKSDDKLPKGIAQSVGFWSTGIHDKMKRGCELAAEKVKKAANGKPIDLITINVYGFSRGAATARHFLSITNQTHTTSIDLLGFFNLPGYFWPIRHPKNTNENESSYPDNIEIKWGYFGIYLIKNKIFEVGEVRFNFVGLYDTVSSHGFVHYNDVKDLGLDAIKKVKMVFQLAADDEYRENFDLTNIDSAGLKGLTLTLPGVHSDIGGSYLDIDVETSVVYEEKHTEIRDRHYKPTPYNTKRAEAFKALLIKEGWYQENELTILVQQDLGKIQLVGERVLYSTYDKIALNKMIMVSKQFGVVYDDFLEKQKTTISDPFVSDIFDQLTVYSQTVMLHRNAAIKEGKPITQYHKESKQISYLNYIKEDDLKKLRAYYLHWSVKADMFGFDPRFGDMLPIEKRKREIQNG